MKELPRRALLGIIAILCLLAGMAAPYQSAVAEPLADLVVGSITWQPHEPAQGESVTFTVTVSNRGAAASAASQLECFIDEAPAAEIQYGAIAPGVTTTCAFTWTAVSGDHNIRAVIDPGNTIEESDDGNNDVNFAFSVLTPDLYIESITWEPREPEIREPVIFYVTVKNRGNQYARASNVEFFIDGASRGYYPVPTLEAGASCRQQYYWTAQAGPHNISATADVLGQVTESDEVNNQRTVRYASANPDLVVSKIKWGPVASSGNITVTMTIANQGTGKADPCYLTYYVDSQPLGSAYITSVAANATTTRSFEWEVWPGSHNIKAFIDSDNGIFEDDESNNETSVLYTTDGTAPDLAIQSISWEPSKPVEKHLVHINVVLENRGNATAIYPTLKVVIDGAEEFPQPFADLAPGATANKTIPWTLPPGAHTIVATADPDNYIAESNETNNVKSATISSYGPASYALALTAITTSPSEPEPGDTVTFSVQIKNGEKALDSAFHVAYYIDHQIWATDYVGALRANAAITKEYDWPAVPGRHTFTAVADANDVIREDNEADNEKSLEIAIAAPDLVIESIVWSPTVPEAGDTVTYTVNVRNQGSAAAARSSTAYYVDGIARGRHSLPEMAPGASAASTFIWIAEQDTHTVLVTADADNALTEEKENNNSRTVTLPASDLIVSGIGWTPDEPSANTTVTFNVTVSNIDAGPAEASRLAAYLDDEPIGHVSIPPLAPGGSITGNLSWNVAAGAHTFKAVAEAESLITEVNETNNDKIAAIYVAPATAAATVPAVAATVNATAAATPAAPDEPDIMEILANEAQELPAEAELPADVEDAPLTLPIIGQLPQLGSWSSMWMIGGGVVMLAAVALLGLWLRRRFQAKSPEKKTAKTAEKTKPAAQPAQAQAKPAQPQAQQAQAQQPPKPAQTPAQQPQAQPAPAKTGQPQQPAQAQPQQPQAQKAQAQPAPAQQAAGSTGAGTAAATAKTGPG